MGIELGLVIYQRLRQEKDYRTVFTGMKNDG